MNYWKSLHKRAKKREEKLKKELQEKEGKIRDLTKRLFGKSNEKSNSGKNKGGLRLSKSPRPRGQQPGKKGHGRTLKPDLPVKDEYIDLSPEEQLCPKYWLRLYLTECANNNGQAPDDLSSFFPWEMDEERLHKLAKPPDTS